MSGGMPRFGPTAETLSGPVELDITAAAEGRRPRADAVRNRAKLLDAAARLVADCGAASLTMDAVAAEAEVGKGTVFRRFGDRNGLLLALLDHVEEQLQQAFLEGPPPLGPGAPAVERLRAFGPAVMRHERDNVELYLAAQPPAERRCLVPARALRRSHLAILLRRTDAAADVELAAETLLASIDTALVHHLVEQRGFPLDRLEAGWQDLVTRFATPPR
ncbi:TetR/AcrR family transcriptional regulator [Saccharopolyspora rhizosphaerae]|uniref:TetR/AcrR family transcriptional regulator n=1 Tax=Saccharopolyspora rhizosphaerae TaxID=2492662 RepID=A0A426K4W0_9PSEU|nr:TetR/AcrR family transcriptional regulator [Saccharopolyspora rhizosphaerae]RRO20428.1 TetR/AcrR family transcriptional regulator [Saccharopolyspora rhizosphaerae]